MDKSIFGTWTLNTPVDEKSRATLVDISYGSHLSPLDEGFCLTLEQASRAKDDVYLTYRSSKNECFRCFTIDELNIYQSSSGSVFGVIVQLDEAYEGCSLMYIGPHQGERILEQYKVLADGNLSVSYLITSPHKSHSQTTLKFSRLGDALVPCPFRNLPAVNNWRLAKCHASGTLRDLHLEFSLPDHITAGTVIHFIITVSYGESSWTTSHRYRDFHALSQFIAVELHDVSARTSEGIRAASSILPPFPPRAVGNLSGRALEERCDGLRAYILAVCSQGGFDRPNIVDTVSAFLQIPAHWNMPPTPVSTPTTQRVQAILAPVNPYYVTVKSARQRLVPMFPKVGIFNWVPFIEYELCVTRVSDDASHSVFRRFRQIDSWFQQIRSDLLRTHAEAEINTIETPAAGTAAMETSSCFSFQGTKPAYKVDVNGSFVRHRIINLETCIQNVLKAFPELFHNPSVIVFLELHRFSSVCDGTIPAEALPNVQSALDDHYRKA